MANKFGSAGIPGAAVLFGTAGLYLAYVGIKDIPFFEGLRQVLRKERPAPRSEHAPYTAPESGSFLGGALDRATNAVGGGGLTPTQANALAGYGTNVAGNSLGLVGNALKALPALRARFPGMTMYGKGSRPIGDKSDHPKGLAIDIMTKSDPTAQQIIKVFKSMPGAKYWMWNHKQGTRDGLWAVRPINSYNEHTDHVHLSFY